VWARGGQAKDIGGDLHGLVGLRAAARDAQLCDVRAAATLDAL
jgi:hypothetical protein